MNLQSKYIQDKDGVKIAPITTPQSVRWANGDNLIDRITLSIISFNTVDTNLIAKEGKYYIFDDVIGTLSITLPTPSDVGKVQTIVFFMTIGATPTITFSSAIPIYYHNGFVLEAGMTYEVNALFNGSAWVIASVEIVIPKEEEL